MKISNYKNSVLLYPRNICLYNNKYLVNTALLLQYQISKTTISVIIRSHSFFFNRITSHACIARKKKGKCQSTSTVSHYIFIESSAWGYFQACIKDYPNIYNGKQMHKHATFIQHRPVNKGGNIFNRARNSKYLSF